jgi:hypothetical protein
VRFEGAVAGECLVDGKPRRTICVFRVHLLPLSALKTLLASAMIQTSSFECEGARRFVARQWELSNRLHDSRAGGPHACLDATLGRALGAARSRKARGGRLTPAQAAVAAGTARGAASGRPENVSWLLPVS